MPLKITFRERVIIFLVIAALLIFAIFYSTGKGIFGIRAEKKFKIIADRSYGIKQASKVKIKDIECGIVDKVYLDKNNQVVIIIRINKEFKDRIKEDSVAKIVSIPFIGVAYIEIEPGSAYAKSLKEGAIIKFKKEKDILQEFVNIPSAINPAIKKINTVLDDIKIISEDIRMGKGTLGKILQEEELYNRFLTITDKTVEVVDEIRPITDNMVEVMNQLPKLTKDIDTTLTEFKKLQKDFSEVADNIKQASTSAKEIFKNVEEGKGTIGKLIKDEKMHNEVIATVDTAKSILNKINTIEVKPGMDANYYDNQDLVVSKVYTKIKPTKNNYIQVGGTFLSYKKEKTDNKLELIYFHRLSNNYSIKGGLLEGSAALGVDYHKSGLNFSVEARSLSDKDYDKDIDNFLLRSYINFQPRKNLWLKIGLNDILNESAPYVGIMVEE